MSTTSDIQKAALAYLDAGLSIIPCNREKIPCLPAWKPYQEKQASIEQVQEWFTKNENRLAIIGGGVSGGLEILDFDSLMAYEKWAAGLLDKDPSLFKKLVFEKSPRPGVHAAYRCPEITIPGSQKLALDSDKKVKIETKAEGGYCLVAPSQGYQLERGDFTQLPDITAQERQILLDLARAQNELVEPEKIERGYTAPRTSGGLLPGADFDERGDIRGYLLDAGWQSRGQDREGRERWCRPGKGSKGHSATLTDGKIFYCFSTNGAPFESEKAYGLFAVVTMLKYGGDFTAAARGLAQQGYGSRPAAQTGTAQPGPQRANSGLTMADVREYVDQCTAPGQKITVDEICRGLACYKRDDRKKLYTYIGRLCKDGIITKDDYLHGGYRRVVEINSYDLAGDVIEMNFYITLPLELHNLIELKADQLLQVSGRYDAGKSTFLYQVMANNYSDNKIILIVSEEWSLNAIKERMDVLGIPRPHENIKVIPMQPGYEDMIPKGRCIVLIDYIRADQNPLEIDVQIQRILKKLDGGIAIITTQKHPGLDRPVGGQFAVHACHHIVMLDKYRETFICKIYRTKNDRNMEGVYRTFKISQGKRIYPAMEGWKMGKIKWDKETILTKDDKDNNDNNFAVVKPGGPYIYKERERQKEKEAKRKKERERNENRFAGLFRVWDRFKEMDTSFVN